MKRVLIYFFVWLPSAFLMSACLSFLTGCGTQTTNIPKRLPGGLDAPYSITVSLNDAFTSVAPNGSEKVQTTDGRYFAPPASLSVVAGAYSGSNPLQYMHGKLLVGAEECQYEAVSVLAVVLTLQHCTSGLGSNTFVAPSTVIELVNHDSPGLLLQADFVLTR